MATGDAADCLRRLKAVLPGEWFPDETPILDALLTGIASMNEWAYELLAYVKKQRRIASATDVNLDLIALDFLGTTLQRRAGESDAAYRVRIQAAIFQEQGTRAAIVRALTALTGEPPMVFEPANPRDTGGYGFEGMTRGSNLGYGVAGGWGSLDLPFQAFIVAYRPETAAPVGIQGYYTLGSVQSAFGGYGEGSIKYILSADYIASSGDLDVFEVIEAVKPIGSVMWVAVAAREGDSSGPYIPPTTTPRLDVDFILDVSPLS